MISYTVGRETHEQAEKNFEWVDDWPVDRDKRKFMNKETKQRIFESVFFRDVESWFSRDIACCDSCYGDFLSMWPSAYSSDDARFQCDSISLNAFYNGSRHLQDMFSEEEFEEFLPSVKCPNCGESLRNWIWPYELPFTPPENYELLIEQISDVANKIPFLLLTHPFSFNILEAVTALATTVLTQPFKERLYRGRSMGIGVIATLADFDFPPKEVISVGRYNHAGDSVLYLASTEEVCKAEMRHSPSLWVSSFDFTAHLKILDLLAPHETDHEFSELLSFISFSVLLSAKSKDQGFHRPEYVFSRFVKDCAVHAGFDAIKYPSTRAGTSLYNIVILNNKFMLENCATNFSYTSPL